MRNPFANPRHLVYCLVHLLLVTFGAFLSRSTDQTWQAIGVSVAAAGIAGLACFVYVFINTRQSDLLEVMTRFGFVGAFPARAAAIRSEYESRLNTMKTNLDIIGFGLRAFREDYLAQIGTLKARGKIRILLIDPDHPSADRSCARQRDSEEANPTGTIAGDVRAFIEATSKLRDDQLRVRLYRCLPSVNIFRVDDDLFWGPYFIGKQSRNTPTFLVRRGGLLFDLFLQQFESIWENDDLSHDITGGDE